jgi:hypothetical protein
MREGQIVNVGEQLRMEGVVRFRDKFTRLECLYFTDHEVLKLYQPQSIRRIGGSTTDRVFSGNVGFVLRSEVSEVCTRKWLGTPASLSLVPIMNFPEVIRHSALSGAGELGQTYVDGLHSVLCRFPDSRFEISRRFGDDFLSLSRLDRLTIMVRELRAAST